MDWAEEIRGLLEVHYPDAPKIRLVMDNLNTHSIASLYQAFEPETALRLAKRLEIHYTPKHGSWLNVAEIELSVMTRQCLGRRIPSIEELRSELTVWEHDRNRLQKGVDWQFTTEDARVKLKRLYPQLNTDGVLVIAHGQWNRFLSHWLECWKYCGYQKQTIDFI